MGTMTGVETFRKLDEAADLVMKAALILKGVMEHGRFSAPEAALQPEFDDVGAGLRQIANGLHRVALLEIAAVGRS